MQQQDRLDVYPSTLRRAENTTDGGQEAQQTSVWRNSLSCWLWFCLHRKTYFKSVPELSVFPNTMLDHIYLSFLSQAKG